MISISNDLKDILGSKLKFNTYSTFKELLGTPNIKNNFQIIRDSIKNIFFCNTLILSIMFVVLDAVHQSYIYKNILSVYAFCLNQPSPWKSGIVSNIM